MSRVLIPFPLRVQSLSAEWRDATTSEPGRTIGDCIELISGNGHFTTVLPNRISGMRGGRPEVCWPLDTRGEFYEKHDDSRRVIREFECLFRLQ